MKRNKKKKTININEKIKNNLKLIIGIVIGLTITGGVYAATIYYDSINVSYDNTTSGLKDANGNDVTTVQGALDALNTAAQNCSSGPDTPFEIGDYVEVVPDASTYKIRTDTTGYTSEQTITPNELTLWRVIDIHSDGSVDAVSEYVSSTNVYFRGTTGYANFVGGLQTIAASYAKTGYTINTRMMGYAGQTSTIPATPSTCTDTTCQTTTQYAFDGSSTTVPSTTSTPFTTTGTGEEYSGGVLGDTLYLRDYQLVQNVYQPDNNTNNYGSTGLAAYKKQTTTKTAYWLASRVYFSGSSFSFNGRNVNTSGDLYRNRFRGCNSGWSDTSNSSALRPIITLKSELTTSGGSGTKASPYTLS